MPAPAQLPAEIEERLFAATDRAAADAMAKRGLRPFFWQPLPRQKEALESKADETLYGGAAGGGKSDLIMGAARLAHYSAVIFRRTNPRLRDSLVPRSLEFLGNPDRYNKTGQTWEFEDGCTIRFRHLEALTDADGHRSAQYDFIGFDELTEFLESQYVFLLSRLRSTRRGQRCRVIAATNPGGEGNDWVMKRWGPWLDPDYRGVRAAPGELRFFLRDDNGKDQEVPEGTPHALSRTYIPARLTDNPYIPEAYRAQLMALPEPLRSQMLNGDWQAGATDSAWQVIPSAWIRAAQDRWRADGRGTQKLDAIGLDVALRGDDYAVKAKRYGNWIAPLEAKHGKTIAASSDLVEWIAPDLASEGGIANIDGVGWGEGAVAICKERGIAHRGIIASKKSEQTAKANKAFRFANAKTEMAWRTREALDPSQAGALCLPPDDDLARDLRSYRWEPHAGGAKVVSKEKQIEDLGHSPDRGEAVLLAVCGFEPPGELLLPHAEGFRTMGRRPFVFKGETGRGWMLNLDGYLPDLARPGTLARAAWYARRGPSACVWTHTDGRGNLTVLDALVIEGMATVGAFAKAVQARSKTADGWHDYDVDCISGPQPELEKESKSPWQTILDAYEEAGGESGECPTPDWIDDGELAGMAGLESIDEWMERSKGERLPFFMVWPKEVGRALEEARFKPDGKTVGDATEEAAMGGGPLVRCLRLLAVQWGR